MEETRSKNQVNWLWLRNLLKVVEEITDLKQVIKRVESSFQDYLGFEVTELYIVESPEKEANNETVSNVDKLASSSFFSRNVIEEIFLHKKPCKVSRREMIFPLESADRILGLLHLKSKSELSDEAYELIWSFCDQLSSHINNITLPGNMATESKIKIKEISNSIFNNLKGFLEASLERLKVLEEQNIQLVKLNETRTELINNVSHELRTPLVSIIGFSKILQRREVEESLVLEASEQIQSAGSRLSRMIDDLIQLNRASTKGWEINIERLDIGEIAKFTVEAIAPLNREHDFTFSFPNDYPMVNGDRKLLRQVIENLLINAVKYSPQGGEINCSISTEEGDDRVKFCIEDEGIGMTTEELERVFERFYRAKNPRTENIAGLGLGLSICKDVIEALNGSIECASKFDMGSKFTVSLERAEV